MIVSLEKNIFVGYARVYIFDGIHAKAIATYDCPTKKDFQKLKKQLGITKYKWQSN